MDTGTSRVAADSLESLRWGVLQGFDMIHSACIHLNADKDVTISSKTQVVQPTGRNALTVGSLTSR